MCPNTFLFPCILMYYHLIPFILPHFCKGSSWETMHLVLKEGFSQSLWITAFVILKNCSLREKCTTQWASKAFHLFLILSLISFRLPLFWLARWSINGQAPKIPSSNIGELVTHCCIFGRYLKAVWNPSHHVLQQISNYMTFVLEFKYLCLTR